MASRLLLIPLVAAGLSAAASASAQPVVPQLTPEQLARPAIVTHDGAAGPIKGTIVAIDADTVRVSTGGRTIEVPFASVRRIDYQGDSVTNGAIVGALVLGVWCAKICGQGTSGGPGGAVVFNAGLGALIGAGIDALSGRRPPIYVRAPGGGAHVGFSLRF